MSNISEQHLRPWFWIMMPVNSNQNHNWQYVDLASLKRSNCALLNLSKIWDNTLMHIQAVHHCTVFVDEMVNGITWGASVQDGETVWSYAGLVFDISVMLLCDTSQTLMALQRLMCRTLYLYLIQILFYFFVIRMFYSSYILTLIFPKSILHNLEDYW